MTTTSAKIINRHRKATLILSILSFSLILGSIFLIIVNSACTQVILDHEQTIAEQEFELFKAERALEQYHYVEELQEAAQKEAEKDALTRCETFVTSQLSGEVVDPFGNPISVDTFSTNACQNQLMDIGWDAFLEKFPA